MERRKILLALGAFLMVRSALAFAPAMAAGIAWFTQYIGLPVSYALSCGLVCSPPLRAFGDENGVCGFDWGSLACHTRNVCGLQLAFCGGAVEHHMYGLQLGILASGYAMHELPFGDYHFCNLDFCHMNGLQFGTFAAKTATANGVQLSAVYAEAQKVNGLQVGLVNRTGRLRGLQVGLVNMAEKGCGLQVGGFNCAGSGLAGCLPVLNFVY